MNHKRIYDSIINNARRRGIPEGYYEVHHILPRCLGGSDETDNLVSLTAREHFICHALLCYIYPNNIKLLYAFHMMLHCKDKNQARYKPSLTYAYLKEQYSINHGAKASEWMKGNKNSANRPMTEANMKALIGNKRAIGVIITEEHRESIRQAQLGNITNKGRVHKKFPCQYCGKETSKSALGTFHGPTAGQSNANCRSISLKSNTSW